MPTNPIADTKTKYSVVKVERVERSTSYEVSISPDQVIKQYNLKGDDAEEWQDRVEEYIHDNWPKLETDPDTNTGETEDNETGDYELVDIEEL